MKNGLVPEYLLRKVRMLGETHDHNIRQINNIRIERCNTVVAERSVTYKGFGLYNKLPKNVKEARNVIIFKRLLKEHW